jgi:hypothetical protein
MVLSFSFLLKVIKYLETSILRCQFTTCGINKKWGCPKSRDTLFLLLIFSKIIILELNKIQQCLR